MEGTSLSLSFLIDKMGAKNDRIEVRIKLEETCKATSWHMVGSFKKSVPQFMLSTWALCNLTELYNLSDLGFLTAPQVFWWTLSPSTAIS